MSRKIKYEDAHRERIQLRQEEALRNFYDKCDEIRNELVTSQTDFDSLAKLLSNCYWSLLLNYEVELIHPYVREIEPVLRDAKDFLQQMRYEERPDRHMKLLIWMIKRFEWRQSAWFRYGNLACLWGLLVWIFMLIFGMIFDPITPIQILVMVVYPTIGLIMLAIWQFINHRYYDNPRQSIR